MIRKYFFNIKISNSLKQDINNVYSRYTHIKKNIFYIKLLEYGIKNINSVPNIQKYLENNNINKEYTLFIYSNQEIRNKIDEIYNNYAFIKKNDFIEVILKIGLEYMNNINCNIVI